MAQGLDELIEWLVSDVAFHGEGKSTAMPPHCFPDTDIAS